MTRRPCLEPGCNQTSAAPRCPTHTKPRAHQTRHNGAHQTLRRHINHTGGTHCAHCGQLTAAQDIEIDHITPLHRNGTDTPGNVQPLCVWCHQTKSAAERLNI